MTAENDSGGTRPRRGPYGAPFKKRSIILVGMMGSGKSSIGRRLAAALDLPFVDADAEIEQAAGMTIEDMFAEHGEPYLREGEERVIRRIRQCGPQVLSTGGGAVASPRTRAVIARSGISLWLDAPVALLLQRVLRRDNRPLLKTDDPKAVLERLLAQRRAFYAEADLKIESRDAPHEAVVDEILALCPRILPGRNRPGRRRDKNREKS